MSKFTAELVETLAKKVMIGLSKEENKLVLDEFDFIDENMNLINEIEGIEQIEPMSHPFDLYEVVMSDDEAESSEAIEDILNNCDVVQDREIEVPKVVG